MPVEGLAAVHNHVAAVRVHRHTGRELHVTAHVGVDVATVPSARGQDHSATAAATLLSCVAAHTGGNHHIATNAVNIGGLASHDLEVAAVASVAGANEHLHVAAVPVVGLAGVYAPLAGVAVSGAPGAHGEVAAHAVEPSISSIDLHVAARRRLAEPGGYSHVAARRRRRVTSSHHDVATDVRRLVAAEAGTARDLDGTAIAAVGLV
mmetsp:Transcript_68893/g.217828  ORF Transcript_68893/g.217828 Transcript_68893/m.217828 type:complete len:207 (+) Transcript_68893:584-1204(+)